MKYITLSTNNQPIKFQNFKRNFKNANIYIKIRAPLYPITVLSMIAFIIYASYLLAKHQLTLQSSLIAIGAILAVYFISSIITRILSWKSCLKDIEKEEDPYHHLHELKTKTKQTHIASIIDIIITISFAVPFATIITMGLTGLLQEAQLNKAMMGILIVGIIIFGLQLLSDLLICCAETAKAYNKNNLCDLFYLATIVIGATPDITHFIVCQYSSDDNKHLRDSQLNEMSNGLSSDHKFCLCGISMAAQNNLSQ